ncbi:MAG: HAD-IIA family hydrolase [Erysipelotrichaceae bacterium]
MKMYMIDLDGTMYRGTAIIDGAKDFIDYLIETNQKFVFLTNNAKRTKAQNVEHMVKMGYEHIKEEHFFTSAMASARYVKKHYKGNKAYYIGQDGLKEALLDNGFILSEDEVDHVFVGLDAYGTYEKYSKALSYLLKGANLIGTNNDRLLAKPDGFNVGNGSIVAMFEYAIHKESPKIGKPYAPILEEACEYFNINKEDAIIVGDNLETDILLGMSEQVETIFVTTGVHRIEDIERYHIQPDRVVNNLSDLIQPKK